MTTYAEFQTYFTRLIWRTGDTEFISDLPVLIRKAEARINRDLRQIGLTATYEAEITSNRFTLPADYAEARSITVDAGVYYVPTTVQRIAQIESDFDSYQAKVFAQIGQEMALGTNATADSPVNVSMVYYTKLVPYESEPAAPYYDTNPDFYEAALQMQCYDYLRDFELSAEYNGKYTAMLDDMKADARSKEFPAGGLDMRLPGIVL